MIQQDSQGNILAISFLQSICESSSQSQIENSTSTLGLDRVNSNTQISQNYHQDSPSVLIKSAQHSYYGILGPSTTGVSPRPSLNSSEFEQETFSQTSRNQVSQCKLDNPGVMYCLNCKKQCPTSMNLELKQLGVWKSLSLFFYAMKCCSQGKSMSKFQETIYSCMRCGSVIARVSIN